MNQKLQEFYRQIRGKRITVLGIGISNTPVIKLLAAHGAEVTARVQPLMEELRDLGMTREEWTDLWKGGDSDA